MRVGFDVTALRAPQGGVGTYTANLLHHLREGSDDDIVPMLPRRRRAGGRTVSLNKTLWMQTLLPIQLARLGADVCHFTNNVAPWWTPCPAIVTIHDTTLWMFPGYHPRRRLLAMRPFIPLGARSARAIIAVSASTKRDIVRTLKVPEDKVHVIYEAPATQFRTLEPTSPDLTRVRARYALPRRFVLYVGTIEPRKNLGRLLRAFEQLGRCGFADLGLVLVGNRGWGDTEVLRSIERLRLQDRVKLLGFAPAEDLVGLYNLAEALAFPSLYEGFGLPVVEAMACGTPVVTSPNGSLAEIAGGAAELVDPYSVESIAAGLRRVLSDGARRSELRSAGFVRLTAAQFNWHTTAAQTRRVYQAAASIGRRA